MDFKINLLKTQIVAVVIFLAVVALGVTALAASYGWNLVINNSGLKMMMTIPLLTLVSLVVMIQKEKFQQQ